MRIISRKPLVALYQKHPESKVALDKWYKITKSATWKSLDEVKQDFNSVDYVGNSRYVFNIKGNTYRVVVAMQFLRQIVYVRFVGTHNEYNDIDCKTV
ncbi:hypothetical protein FACS189452_08590 [Bacteroidia bacterium]|nr:hypothetical protein FACS189452_08590 [Bacteroidia bacterium]GHT80199.1 hypothetical protein FACS189467_1760 [Bacteroidia bacterium]